MSFSPDLGVREKEVLEILSRGHPDRKMTSTNRSGAVQVSALTWAEIQIALKASHSEIGDAVAKLVSKKLIGSGRQNPSFWGRLRGDGETYFFWITETGVALLQKENIGHAFENREKLSEMEPSSTELDKVDKILVQLGYDMAPYGLGVALLSLESGYSAAEAASHLALVTLALDCKYTNDIRISMALFTHSMTMIEILSEYRDAGQFRLELYNNDVTAMAKVSYTDRHQMEWIEKVLSDPLIQKERVATSRINYQEMVNLGGDTEIDT